MTVPGADDLMAKLVRLGEMKTAGLLTDEEFAAAKAELLA
jgi:Short C-terminal domain